MNWQKNTAKYDWYVGMDIGGTSVKLLAGPSERKIEHQLSVVTGSRPVEEVVQELSQRVIDLTTQYGGVPRSIGIGFPGIVDEEGVIVGAPNLPHWTKTSLREIFQNLFHTPVAVANDANCAALAEAEYLRHHQGYHHVVFLTLGTGVGAGIVLNGEILSGAKGFAAEAGHITVEPNGYLCGCGRRGCLEQYFSAKGITQVARQEFSVQGDISVKHLFKMAHKGCEFELRILRKCVDKLAIGISNLCAILDPDCIVLGGGISKDGDFLLDLLEGVLSERLQYPGYTLPDLRISHYHEQAGGVGCLILAQKLVSPADK